MDEPAGRLPLLDRPLPAAFELRFVTVEPDLPRPYDEAEWRDAVVVVERGDIELEALSGARVGFRRGDVLWLAALPLRALHNHGREPVWLVAVSRRRRESRG
jgi:hypothetical protein